MPQTIKPATPLPWRTADSRSSDGKGPDDCPVIRAVKDNSAVCCVSINRLLGEKAPSKSERANAAYIVAAANAYPRLVEALLAVVGAYTVINGIAGADPVERVAIRDQARALLRSLGESE